MEQGPEQELEKASGADLSAACLQLVSTLELEVLQELLLRVFSELARADSAALWVGGQKGWFELKARKGQARPDLPDRVDREGPLGPHLERGQPFAAAASAATARPADLFVPLLAGGQAIGLVLLGGKGGELEAPLLAGLGALSGAAGIALRNALRFKSLERGGLRDRHSPTYNLSYFTDYAGKELYKAGRYSRQFSVSILRFDSLELLRSQLPAKDFAETTRALVSVIANLARDSDVVARASESELYLLLPETDRFGVMMLERRIEEAVRALDERSDEDRSPATLAIGSATYPHDGHDFDELLARCRERIEEARLTLRRQLQLQNLDCWQSLTTLLGPWAPQAGRLSEAQARAALPSYRGPLPDDHFQRVQREIGRELGREPRSRGLLYVSGGEAAHRFALLEALPSELAAHVCLLVGRDQPPIDHPAVTTLQLHGLSPLPPAALQLELLLYLSEGAAYAYARRRHEPLAFHSSDRPLVDHLISSLQRAYALQPY